MFTITTKHKDTWFSHSTEKMRLKSISFLFFLVRDTLRYYVNRFRRIFFMPIFAQNT